MYLYMDKMYDASLFNEENTVSIGKLLWYKRC